MSKQEQEEREIAKEISKDFWPVIKILRFYVVLRRFGYVDTLIYSNNPDQIINVMTEALREYISYVSSAVQREIKIRGDNKPAYCLVVAKKGDIPDNFAIIYDDVVYGIDRQKQEQQENETKSEQEKQQGQSSEEVSLEEYCISPLNVIFNKENKVEKVELVYIKEDKIKDLYDKILSDIRYARVLASLAVSGG